jgi:hypothetical protein
MLKLLEHVGISVGESLWWLGVKVAIEAGPTALAGFATLSP